MSMAAYEKNVKRALQLAIELDRVLYGIAHGGYTKEHEFIESTADPVARQLASNCRGIGMVPAIGYALKAIRGEQIPRHHLAGFTNCVNGPALPIEDLPWDEILKDADPEHEVHFSTYRLD